MSNVLKIENQVGCSKQLADYIFYADCHGLISITPWDPSAFHSLKHAALANQQRFPVYGTIPLSADMVGALNDMCGDKHDRKIALNALKEAKYNLPTDRLSHILSNMERIPNDNLDPFWSDPETSQKVRKKVRELLEEEDDE